MGSTAGIVQSWSDTQVIATVAPTSVTGIVRIQQNGAWSNALTFTEPGNTTLLVPNLLNLAIGDTATVQATNLAGQSLTGLTWTTSNPAVVSLSTDNPPVLTGVAAGHATILAGTASIDVIVTAGTLSTGTVIWSNPGDGSGVQQVVPAVPSPSGVADVFAYNNDLTVTAIRSDGTTAWTADVSAANGFFGVLPDFLGGLVFNDMFNHKIMRIDGTTGQPTTLYTATGSNPETSVLAVHPDGTIFAAVSSDSLSIAVIGIDPMSGGVKFTVPSTDPSASFGGASAGPIIAGDGNFYLPYITENNLSGGGTVYDFKLLQVSSGGQSAVLDIHKEVTPGPFDVSPYDIAVITNADQGTLVSWNYANPGMAVTSGTGVSVVSTGPLVPGTIDLPLGALQLQDGSYVGTIHGAYPDNQPLMIGYDASGGLRWTVEGIYQPQIATDDGGFIALNCLDDLLCNSGGPEITFDGSGGATGQLANLLTPSWTAQTYSLLGGGFADVVQAPPQYASSYGAVAGGNLSGTATSVAFLTLMEGLPLFSSGRGPACKLTNVSSNLLGAAREQYDSDRQALLSGNYLTSQPCATFFNAKGRSEFFNQLTSAVTNQVPRDGLLTTISMYEAGLWAHTDVNKVTFPAAWQQTPVYSNFPDPSASNTIITVAEAQVQPPANVVYIDPRPKVFKKELTQSTILHEALHNLTGFNDSALAEVLGTTLSSGGGTNTINKVLVKNGCAAN